MSSRHRHPYIAEDPPFGIAEDLRDYLSRELKRIENAFVGVDLERETRWDDLRVPMGDFVLRGVNDPGFEQLLDDGGGSVGVFAYKFAGSTSDEELFFTVQLPHSYQEGSTLKPHIHWTVEDTASSQTVVWGLEYAWAQLSATFAATTQTLRATATPAAILFHNVTAFGDISASLATMSSQFICRLFREQSNGGDTFAQDAAVVEFDIHFQQDSLGSRKEYAK